MSAPVIGAIVLAAGQSRRMGAAKLALPFAGRTILEATLEAVAVAGLPALVVLGGHADRLRPLVCGAAVVDARDHDLGLAHSLRAGIAASPAEWAGALIVLADMPWVRPDTYRRLAAALAGGAVAVRPSHAGQPGNPAGFGRALFPRLLTLEGDCGAAALMDRVDARNVQVDDPGVHRDIDTPADLTDRMIGSAPR